MRSRTPARQRSPSPAARPSQPSSSSGHQGGRSGPAAPPPGAGSGRGGGAGPARDPSPPAWRHALCTDRMLDEGFCFCKPCGAIYMTP
eukprot:6369624-Alexandrium_andersonii.AAC.1